MDRSCFACGSENPRGLHLTIEHTDHGAQAHIIPSAWTQGYKGFVHGGIICTLLDEIAVWAAYAVGHYAATAEISVRFKQSMPVEKTYLLKGRIISIKHKLAVAESEITDDAGQLIAQALVKLIKIEQR